MPEANKAYLFIFKDSGQQLLLDSSEIELKPVAIDVKPGESPELAAQRLLGIESWANIARLNKEDEIIDCLVSYDGDHMELHGVLNLQWRAHRSLSFGSMNPDLRVALPLAWDGDLAYAQLELMR